MRPATRIGRYLLYPGGHIVRLSRRDQFLFAVGLKRRIPWDRNPYLHNRTVNPRTNERRSL